MEVAELRGRVMASDLHIIVADPPPGQLGDAVRFLEHLESVWSRFITTSDISRINVLDGGTTTIDETTETLLATMIDAVHMTAGRYDPTILPVLVANGYRTSRTDPTRRTEISARASAEVSIESIVLETASSTVTVPAGLVLDPGGIGKGLAADLTAARLVRHGAGGALVTIGGDLAMAGNPPHPDGWFVAIEHADPADGILCTVAVSGGGVATSSTQSRRWCNDGRAVSHLIDPTTMAPTTSDLMAVTVIAATGWAAEAHATAAILVGSQGVIDYLGGHGLSGVAITNTHEVLLTGDLAHIDLRPRHGES